MKHTKLLIICIAILACIPTVLGAQVVVNSVDWRDIYSGIHWAQLEDMEAHFVVDEIQGADLPLRMGGDTEIILITGREQAMPGFRNLLQSRGYEIVEEISSRDAQQTNAELAVRAQPTNVVVVDDAYGFNALAVGTYGIAHDAAVLFAGDDALDAIEQLNPDEILLYGQIPRAFTEELNRPDAVIINEQDKFEDNFALVQRFQQLYQKQTVLLTNGEFIEDQIVTDTNPVLFTGRQNVPDEVMDFLRQEEFRVGVMVGNSLAPNARAIKDATGMSIFIKFAQGRNEQQYSLDLYAIPTPNPLVSLSTVEYDPSSRTLYVTYENPGEVAVYATGAFTGPQGTVEDAQPVFVEAGTYKTQTYLIEDPGEQVDYTILYGAYPNSLELLLQGTVNISRVTISDNSEIVIRSARYDLNSESFFVTIENIGEENAYVLLEAVDVRIGTGRERLASEVTRVSAGDTEDIELPAALTEEDLARNRALEIEAYYGAREFSLVKFTRETLSFDVEQGGFPVWFYIVAAAVAVILVWFAVGRKKQRY